MKTKIIIFALLLTGIVSNAQQDAQYTQYMYNTININPAYAGSREVLSIFGLYRTQWVGLEGAPKTNALSLNSPLGDTRLGAGLSFVNDQLGPTVENQISVDLSYYIPTSEDFKLSIGVKGTANLFNLDRTKLKAADPTDAQYQNLNGKFTPNVGAGLYFHSNKTYFGVSVPNFLQTTRYADNSASVNRERFNLYFIGGHVFDLTPDVKLKPTFLFKAVQGAPLQADFSLNAQFIEKFVVGAAYRWSAAVSLLAGFQASESLYLGYGYDLETTRLRNYNSGSHEIFIRYEFFKRQKRIVTPRFF
jgi:type IX secretion system PorP/SprF family membrane protein